jgi:uncharacterized protein YndB with AHSA1/START domain
MWFPGRVATVEVTREMAGDPQDVYAVIADVTQMDQWSPESAGARWTSGAPGTVGSQFRGRNRNGLFRWSTTCTVTAADAGRRFAFDVTLVGLPVASWEYELTPSDGGCAVTERTTDRRSALVKIVGAIGTGVTRRADHNRQTMVATLDSLARAMDDQPTG